MKFEEFYQSLIGRGFADTVTNRSLAICTWDAAICSAQAACLDQGRQVSRENILDRMTQLHTWTKDAAEVGPVS
jgi:hypothetical protein